MSSVGWVISCTIKVSRVFDFQPERDRRKFEISIHRNPLEIVLYRFEKIPKNDTGVLRTGSKETKHRAGQ